MKHSAAWLRKVRMLEQAIQMRLDGLRRMNAAITPDGVIRNAEQLSDGLLIYSHGVALGNKFRARG